MEVRDSIIIPRESITHNPSSKRSSIVRFEHRTPTERISNISFNQDKTCIACATNMGYFIVKIPSFEKICHRQIGGIAKIRMLFKSNIIALVGGGKNPYMSSRFFSLYDDMAQKCLGSIDCNSDVKIFRIKKDIIFIVTLEEIRIFSYRDQQVIKTIRLIHKHKLLFACAYDDQKHLIAYNGATQGSVMVYDYVNDKEVHIQAHKHPIQTIEMDYKGRCLITASSKGTLLRIFNPLNGECYQEVRCGLDDTQVKSISINQSADLMLIAHNDDLARLFKISIGDEDASKQSNDKLDEYKNRSTFKTKFMKKLLPFLDSEWSFYKLKLGDKGKRIHTVNFDNGSDYLLAVTDKGIAYRLSFTDLKKEKKKATFKDKVDLIGLKPMAGFDSSKN